MSADALSASSRAFYEQTRFKMAASIFLGSMACMALAYCSTYGGESNSANFMVKKYNDLSDDKLEQAQTALAGGYGTFFPRTILLFCGDFLTEICISLGFGSFMFFVAFAVFLSAAIYISPMFCGSNTEKKMISKPQEIDSGKCIFVFLAFMLSPI